MAAISTQDLFELTHRPEIEDLRGRKLYAELLLERVDEPQVIERIPLSHRPAIEFCFHSTRRDVERRGENILKTLVHSCTKKRIARSDPLSQRDAREIGAGARRGGPQSASGGREESGLKAASRRRVRRRDRYLREAWCSRYLPAWSYSESDTRQCRETESGLSAK